MTKIPSCVVVIVAVALALFAPVPSAAFHLDPPLAPEPPFVVCQNQTYALCAAASCFIYNLVAYCQCDVMKGDSISLQLAFSTATGEENVCDVNAQGKTNGFMVSTFSLPPAAFEGWFRGGLHLSRNGQRGQWRTSAGQLRPV